MTSVSIDPLSLLGKIPPPQDKYRWYSCLQNAYGNYACTRVTSFTTIHNQSKLIQIPSFIPCILDRPYLWYTLQPNVWIEK